MFLLARVNRECFYDVSAITFGTVVIVADCWLHWCWSRLEVCRSEAVFLEFLWLYFNTMFDVYHTFATITHCYSGLSCRPLRCGRPSRRSLRSCRHQPPDSASYQTVNCWQPSLPVVGPQIWNNLPEDVTSADSLSTFRRLLKTHLFRKSFPDYMLDINWLSLVDLAVVPLNRRKWLAGWASRHSPVT